MLLTEFFAAKMESAVKGNIYSNSYTRMKKNKGIPTPLY